MIDNTADMSAWKRLGAMLIQQRVALDPRYRNRRVFAQEAGLDYRLIYDVEEARRTNFGASTIAAMEQAYRLAPGAIPGVLAGGELAAAEGTPPHKPPRPHLAALPDPAPSVRDDDELPIIASMKAAPGYERYRADVDAERDAGQMTDDVDELRIWARPQMSEDAKRVLVAYRRLVADAAAGLKRA